jgi:hypothetical protein
MSGGNWVQFHRRLLEHRLWLAERFTRGQAWVDLFGRASYADHIATEGNHAIPVKRGQLLTSQSSLAKRWRWDRETVSRFFRLLASLNMCHIETSKATDTGYTLVTIVNYDIYQSGRNDVSPSDPASDAPTGASSDPASMPHPCHTINKGKKGKNLADAGASAGGGALTPESRKRKPSKPTDPNVQLVIDAYHDAFRSKYGSPPPLNGGKCGAIAKQLLRGRPVTEAVWLVREFLEAPPQFYADKNLCGMEHILAAAPTLLARKATEGRP